MFSSLIEASTKALAIVAGDSQLTHCAIFKDNRSSSKYKQAAEQCESFYCFAPRPAPVAGDSVLLRIIYLVKQLLRHSDTI